MNLLEKLIASARISDPLNFGINENVILQSITNEEQVWDGQILEKNCHMRFQKLNEKGNPIQESRFSYFNADPKIDKHPVQHLLTQLEQMTEIAMAMNPKLAEKYSTKASKIIKSEENLIVQARGKKAKEFQKELVDAFVDTIKTELDKKYKLRLKVVTSWDGKYINLPNNTPIIESMNIDKKDSHLSVSHQETLNHMKTATNPAISNGQVIADNAAEKPTINPTLSDL